MNARIDESNKNSQNYLHPTSGSTRTCSSDEQKALLEQDLCPKAPSLKPRNMCFKFNSDKCFLPRENMVEYTPFFYSEGDDSVGSDTEESTLDVFTIVEDRCSGNF